MQSGWQGRHIGWRAALTALVAVLLLPALLHPGAALAAHRGGVVPPLYDRTYKCDQVERLPAPPELVILGGSRAQRFDPDVVQRLTGLSAYNFAVQNSRPEDAYAMARYLFWRAPGVKLRCFWALQVTTLADSPLHPGLLGEPRLTQFLPRGLVKSQQDLGLKAPNDGVQWFHEYSPRGQLLRNGYDLQLERGIPFSATLQTYLSRMVPRAAVDTPYGRTRAQAYFERTLELFNLHGVTPVLVIMPYHPTVLQAFRAVGWQEKADESKAFLESLRSRYAFTLLDYTDIASFGGTADAFYDGAHVKAENATRILEQAVKDAPGGFR